MATHLITPYEIKLDTDTKEWQYSALISFSPEAFSDVKITAADGLSKYLKARYPQEEAKILIKTIELGPIVMTAKTALSLAIRFAEPCLGTIGETNILMFPYYQGIKASSDQSDYILPENDFQEFFYRQYAGISIPILIWEGDSTHDIRLRSYRKDATNWTEADMININMMGSWSHGK